jgi:N-acetylglutamate synthase-like GNAT family acetyltransferase
MSTVQPIEVELSGGRVSAFVAEPDAEELIDYLSEHTDKAIQVSGLLNGQGHRVAVLKEISVDPDRRLRGVGNRLMNQFLEETENLGVSAILLVANGESDHNSNFNLMDWFQSFGFAFVETTSTGPLMVYPDSVASEFDDEL